MAFRDSRPLLGDDPALVRVRDPGELVTALPAIMGFHPCDSLILVATGDPAGGCAGLTLRADLPPPVDVPAVCRLVAAKLLVAEPAGAAVVVICDPDGSDPPRPEVAAEAAEALEARGVGVHTVMWATGTASGAKWACYGSCGCSGVLRERGITAAAAAAATAGRVIYRDRSELERLVAPAAPEVLRRREALLTEAVDTALATGDPAASHGVAADPERAWGLVRAAIDDAAGGRFTLDDARVVTLAHALGVPEVRNAALETCAGPQWAAAEQVWAALSRETPDPEAAEPAALLAASALLHGDGALANVALDRAVQAWPGHSLTVTLSAIAATGMRPGRVHDVLRAIVAIRAHAEDRR